MAQPMVYHTPGASTQVAVAVTPASTREQIRLQTDPNPAPAGTTPIASTAAMSGHMSCT